MRRARQIILSLVATGLSACGNAGSGEGRVPVTITSIASADAALFPCAASQPDAPCVLLAAGGKRLLFGTPAGLRQKIDLQVLGSLDAVFLFSLQGADLEGLDEVRNVGWTAGREDKLPVAGPAGTRDVLGALNKAYEVSDAQIFVATPPKGGFGAALLGVLPGEGDAKAKVFDTGDLTVTKIESASGQAGYWIDYNDRRAVLQPCGMDTAVRFNDRTAFVLGCEEADATWPLQDVQYLVQGKSGSVDPEAGP